MSPEQAAAERTLAALEEERNYFLFPHRLASGEVRPVEVYSVPFDVRGRRVLLSMVHDLSSRPQPLRRMAAHRPAGHPARQPGGQRLRRQRRGKQPALISGAAAAAQKIQLRGVFHPFGHHVPP